MATVEEIERIIQSLQGGSLDARKGSLAHQAAVEIHALQQDAPTHTWCTCDDPEPRGYCDLHDSLPQGLCGQRGDHEPHRVAYAAVADGPMWCHADQTKRLPFALEQRS
jgi:hypothetical protein